MSREDDTKRPSGSLWDDIEIDFSLDAGEEKPLSVTGGGNAATEALRQARQRCGDLIAQGWQKTWAELFGAFFTEGMAPHHQEACEWHWQSRLALLEGKKPEYDAYFPIWSRGHNKSGIARRIAVLDGLLHFAYAQPAYTLYFSRSKDMVKKHATSLENLLKGRRVAAYAAELGQVRKDDKRRKSWTAAFLYTQANAIYHFAGLDEGMAGGNVETNMDEGEGVDERDMPSDVRVTLFLPDDIDGREDSAVMADTRFNTLTTEVLPMGQDTTLTFWASNLITDFSCMTRVYKQRARILTGRKPTHPIKAVNDLVTEQRTVDGIVRDAYVSGTPTWKVWDTDRIQSEINRFGLPAFLKECQHEVEADKSGNVLKNWNDAVHVISDEEFATVFGTPEMPRAWPKWIFHDWSRTKSEYHACVAGFITTSPQSSELPGFTFLFHPLSFAEGTESDDVALRLLKIISPQGARLPGGFRSWDSIAQDTFRREGLEGYGLNLTDLIEARRNTLSSVMPDLVRPILEAQNYQRLAMSHEAKKGVRLVYQRSYGLPFKPVNPGADGGVDVINRLQRVDYDLPHPFRPSEKGYTRFFVVVPKARLPLVETGNPTDLTDSDLLRHQFKTWRVRPPKLTETGIIEGALLKMSDDFGNGLMMLFHRGELRAEALTPKELVIAHLSDTVQAQLANPRPLTPQEELRQRLELARAQKKVGYDLKTEQWADEDEWAGYELE